MKAAIQYHAGVDSVGERRKNLRRPPSQLRGKAVLQRCVSTLQRFHRKIDGTVLRFQCLDLTGELFYLCLQRGPTAQSGDLPGEPVGGRLRGGKLGFHVYKRGV